MVKVSLQYVLPAFGNGPDLRGSEILYFGRVPMVGELVEFVRKEDPATVYVFPCLSGHTSSQPAVPPT